MRAAWPDLDLAADANGSLSAVEEAVLDRIDGFGLAYLEQPLPADDLEGSAAVARRMDTPIALDESVSSDAGARTAIAFGAADLLNVKPARVGGPVEAARIVKTAADRGIPVFVGGMLESGVGRAAALAVAALPGCTAGLDLGPSTRYFDPDLTAPFGLTADGTIAVPTGPGIGVRPDLDRLEEVTVEVLESRHERTCRLAKSSTMSGRPPPSTSGRCPIPRVGRCGGSRSTGRRWCWAAPRPTTWSTGRRPVRRGSTWSGGAAVGERCCSPPAM